MSQERERGGQAAHWGGLVGGQILFGGDGVGMLVGQVSMPVGPSVGGGDGGEGMNQKPVCGWASQWDGRYLIASLALVIAATRGYWQPSSAAS